MTHLYWVALKSIWAKEINRFARIWIQTLVPPVITMTLYFIIFGNLIGSRIGDAKFQRNIEELLVAPVPTHIVIAGYVGGGVARGICVGILVTAVSLFFVPFHVHSWLMVAVTLLLTAVMFSLAGLLNAVFARTFDDISLIPTFVLTPLTYLGGVFYSLTLLPPFWQAVSKLNPVVYMISGFRYGFLGINDVPLVFTLSVLVAFIVVFYILAWTLIQRGRGLRT
ncbi:MAG: ABC transporter permease [Pantoea sp.]|nr:ABC transporter permease [Pantoea sp.]